MTFQNMTSIFNCTYEESLALWDYLMFLRVKTMLRQPPLPAITKEDMEFEKSRAVHPMTQQWFDDMEAIRQGKKAPGDTAPTQAEWVAQVNADLGAEAPYPQKTKAEYKEKERRRLADQTKEAWSNCYVALPKVEALYNIKPIDMQTLLCEKCHEELYFGRVKDGTYIVCFQCGTKTKFQYEDGKE